MRYGEGGTPWLLFGPGSAVTIFLNEASAIRLVGAILADLHDKVAGPRPPLPLRGLHEPAEP